MTPLADQFEALAKAAEGDPFGARHIGRYDEFAWWAYCNRAAISSALTSAPPVQEGWRGIETHDGTTRHVQGWNKEMGVHETWYFAPSSRTRDWWIVGIQNRKWKPTHYRPLPAAPEPTGVSPTGETK